MDNKYVTIKEAAKLLGVTPMTLRNWGKKGQLIAYRNPINNYRIYRRDQIDLFMRKVENSKNQNKGKKIDIRMIWKPRHNVGVFLSIYKPNSVIRYHPIPHR